MIVLTGDCRALMPAQGPFDMIVADPPYGDTSLAWDQRVDGWLPQACSALKPTGSLWAFGSLRCFMATAERFVEAGFRYAQEIVWEKQNGSSFHVDRFKRVHELVVQFYRADAPWRNVYNDVQTSLDATARTVRRKQRPPHMGHIDAGRYTSHDGGPPAHALGSFCSQLPWAGHPSDRETVSAARNSDPHQLPPGRPRGRLVRRLRRCR